MELQGKKYVVLYLENWQMRMTRDFLGVESRVWSVPVGDQPVMKYFPMQIRPQDVDPKSKRMYLTECQRQEIRAETGEACDFVVLSRAILPEYMAPAIPPAEEPAPAAAPESVMFQPHVSFTVEKDGRFRLHAVTLTPSTGYSAGRAVIAPPPNVRLTAQALPVMLEIRHRRRGLAQPVITPVMHRLHHLDLTGKTSILVFTMVDGQVGGMSNLPPPAATPRPLPGPVVTSDWHAWLDTMPPGPGRLHVTGTVQAPTPGYEVELVARAAGAGGGELALDLVLRRKPGIWPQVITPILARYDAAAEASRYTTVVVHEPDGDQVILDVDIVH